MLFHRTGDVERLESLDAATGQPIWKSDFPATYEGGVDPDTGPRCAPVIHRENVYAFGAAGRLHCVRWATGEPRWSRDLYADCDAEPGYFGAGSAPLVSEGRLLVNVGGRNGCGLVALDPETGKTLWNRSDERASYSSPIAARVGDRACAIFVTRWNTVGVDPSDGSELFRFAFGKRGATVNAASPLVLGDTLFVTANYGVGARLMTLGAGGASQVWSSDEALSSQYPTPVAHRGFLFGVHGREDVGVAELRCIEAATGSVRWSQRGFGMAHLIRVDDRLLILAVDGRLVLAEAMADRYRPVCEFRVTENAARALPALSEGRFYFRDNAGQRGMLQCLQLAERTASG